MKTTLKLINEFEERNNISISLVLQGDGSCSLQEFWDYEVIKSFDKIDELHTFLENGNLKKDKKGLSISPIQIVA
jgi:hypothetical protein